MFGPGVSTIPSATTVTPSIALGSTTRIPHSPAHGLGEVVSDVVQKVAREEVDGEQWIGQPRIVAGPVISGEPGQAVGQGLSGSPQFLRHERRLLIPVVRNGLRRVNHWGPGFRTDRPARCNSCFSQDCIEPEVEQQAHVADVTAALQRRPGGYSHTSRAESRVP
ncbi:hypothetical protein SAM23877_7358 [Streptomyces ambofaciens ATCC 23877]|uniref:Uncharacterized protein n=1 Tax=Streptomyces ambofaciens (strain ATCC 23877 / 3486 / DSM 40053 / JCM 4204 / NBRC 12836 / NRRL B-2516) TaxID=278992 RepID=A0A0K2B541_STRA7|nr:hypothetical protein SAM23877_7358 [Streptomyces ambofaciens ATCC 23877]